MLCLVDFMQFVYLIYSHSLNGCIFNHAIVIFEIYQAGYNKMLLDDFVFVLSNQKISF